MQVRLSPLIFRKISFPYQIPDQNTQLNLKTNLTKI